jgi:hypothetical protein
MSVDLQESRKLLWERHQSCRRRHTSSDRAGRQLASTAQIRGELWSGAHDLSDPHVLLDGNALWCAADVARLQSLIISAPPQRDGYFRLNICLRPRPRHWNWYELCMIQPNQQQLKGPTGSSSTCIVTWRSHPNSVQIDRAINNFVLWCNELSLFYFRSGICFF